MAMASRFLLQIHHTGCITSTVIPAVIRLDPRLRTPLCGGVPRWFHCSSAFRKNKSDSTNLQEIIEQETEKKTKSLVTHSELFEQAAKDAKSKANFNRVLDTFNKKDIRRRGHVEFIYAALRKMPEFRVERDVTVYNKLLDVFPKEVFVPRNFIQRMFNHYPRQQECGVQVLEQMENYGVMPNMETKVLLVQIFGEKSHPMRKYQRIMYWFPKFKNLNPFPVPHELPQDPVDVARLSLTRITNDLDAKIRVYQLPSTHFTEAGEENSLPHIVDMLWNEWRVAVWGNPSNITGAEFWQKPKKRHVFLNISLYKDHTQRHIQTVNMSTMLQHCSQDRFFSLFKFGGVQSPEQCTLLAKHNPNRPVFVEGPFPLWLRKTCVHYYLLRADPIHPEEQIEDELDPELVGPEQSFFFPQCIDLDLNRDLGDDNSFDVDDVVEGAVYAMCMTGQGDQATLAQWISGLQEDNPVLGQVPTVFRLDSGFRELQKVEDIRHDSGQNQHQGAEEENILEGEVLHSQGMKQ